MGRKSQRIKPYFNDDPKVYAEYEPGRMLPPSREEDIPFCDPDKVYSPKGPQKMTYFYIARGNPVATTDVQEVDKKDSEDDDDVEKVKVVDGAIGGVNKIPPTAYLDYVAPNGMRVTEIGGWEETEIFEPITMMGLNSKLLKESHPRFSLKKNGMYHVRLENIVDPLNFFMDLIIDPPSDGCATWEESLQKFYNDKENCRKYKMRTLLPMPGQQYAILNEHDGQSKWERVRVLNVIHKEQTVNALLMDRLQAQGQISYDALHELHPRFGNWHRCPLNGGLRDVVPKQDPSVPFDLKKAGMDTWSDEAIEYLRSYAKRATFWAYIVTREFDRKDNLPHPCDETRFMKVSVILFENGIEPEKQIPINAWMVVKGYATPIRTMTYCYDFIKTFHGLNLEEKKPSECDNCHRNPK